MMSVSVSGEPIFMLGIVIKRTDKTIDMNQTETINELLRKYKVDYD